MRVCSIGYTMKKRGELWTHPTALLCKQTEAALSLSDFPREDVPARDRVVVHRRGMFGGGVTEGVRMNSHQAHNRWE